MSTISKHHVKLISLLLIVSLIGIVVTHPHEAHSHETEATASQHSHSSSHQQHETPDEPDHSEFTARLPGTSFVVSFAALNIISLTSVSDLISLNLAPHVIPDVTKYIDPTLSLTRVYLL